MRIKIFNWNNLSQLGTERERFRAMKFALDLFFLRPLIERGDVDVPEKYAKACEALGVKIPGMKINTPSQTGNTSSVMPVVADVIIEAKGEDFGYLEIFDLVDMRNVPQTTFDILDVTNGITFNQRKPGEEAKMYHLSDTKAQVAFLEFAAGMGFLDVWMQFQQFYKFEDAAIQVRRRYYQQKAAYHYALIAATTGTQAFSNSDAETIDAACAAITNATKDKGLFDGDNPPFVVAANPTLRRRLVKAIFPFSQNPNDTTSQAPVSNIRKAIFTPELAATHYWVGIPGGKNKRGDWKDLTVKSQRDELKSAEDFVWHGQYNAAIGEQLQWKKCSLS